MDFEAELRAKETGDPRWLDPGFWRANNQSYSQRRAYALRKADAARIAAKTRKADPIFRHLRAVAVNARKNGNAKGRGYALTDDDLWAIYLAADGRCQITGIAFDISKHEAGRSPYSPSLDRIDCAKGYVKGNVRLVVQIANLAMNVWGEAVLHDFIWKATESRPQP